jgi:two-component system sensor histidine kinase RegB
LRRGRCALLLGYDIAQLTVLMTLTGGIENPFAFLILAPVLIAAISLPLRYTLPLGVLAAACSTLIAFYFWPLPWTNNEQLVLPPLYFLAIWVANLVAIVFIGAYAWQVAEEGRPDGGRAHRDRAGARARAAPLAARRTRGRGRARARHALCRPSRWWRRSCSSRSDPTRPYADDVKLLREQAQRCREILGKLSALPAGGAPFERAKLSVLIDEVVAPHRNFGIAIDVVLPPQREDEPVTERSPAILYGLGNLVENAVDFATSRVEIAVRWSEQDVAITISDDGPGFPRRSRRIGEPYVTSRRRTGAEARKAASALGSSSPRRCWSAPAPRRVPQPAAPEKGAVVRVRWPRQDIEAPVTQNRGAT